MVAAVQAATEFLRASDAGALLGRVGQTIKEVPRATHLDKRFIQKSYRGDLSRPPDDLLTGLGVFYVTEQRRLFLDCTAGHYQMTWGYSHPRLTALVREALDAGIVWDDHSNIPGNTVKQLSVRLVEAANGRKAGGSALLDDDKALNTVLLGVCTGSVAANGALKIALKHHQVVRPGATPVLIALRGNYHGTDFLAQRLRGMWKEYFRGITVVEIEPNDTDALRETFTRHRGRVAGIFLELVMMNREAILLDDEFVHAARALCDQADACLVIDEIQTGFWFPRCFLYHEYGILPDILIVGKGMTAGLHPLSALVYRRKYDRLEQYDTISTNGNAPLAALAGLGCMALIADDRKRIGSMNRHFFDRLQELSAADPQRVAGIRGRGLLAGIKFHNVADALDFHRRLLARGLWTRVHAYHAGHSTLLTKLALAADRQVADFVVDTFHATLREMNHA
jgi:acetylornithine/succinyldiaminopimelate/putrescine aminotransferase